MYSERGDLKEAGFPHSEICGSAPICRLPAAYRRLSRPSSPIIAKASTTCTYSLDPITLPPLSRRAPRQSPSKHSQDHRKLSRLCIPTPFESRDTMQYITQCPRYSKGSSQPRLSQEQLPSYPKLLKSSRSTLLEEAPINLAKKAT